MAKAEPGEGTVPTGSSRNQSSALSFLLVAYPAPYLRVGMQDDNRVQNVPGG